jgi:tetratricopeptide (TPR) repeat protein
MTGNALKQILRLIGLTTAILVLCAANTFAQQEKISPLSDYQYKRDYARYESIKKETDPQKKADLLLAFIKERPISRILLYAATDYMECVKPYLDKKDYAKAISMDEALLALIPSEKTVESAGIPIGVEEFLKGQLMPTRILIQKSLLTAYYQSGNLPKTAETAEKLYSLEPDKALLPLLAQVYLKMNNTDKFLAYGEKILANTPIEQPQGYGTALQMAQVYIQRQELNKAIDLFTKVMNVYGDKVPPGVQESAWNTTRAVSYGVMASGAYADKNYEKAQGLYERVLKFDPKRDDAYYFIGMSKWQNKDQEGAIDSFAKCVILNKSYAKKAQQYLEELYKAQHNDTLDGLDQVLAKAKSELGIN